MLWCLKKVVPSFVVRETHHDLNIDARSPPGTFAKGDLTLWLVRALYPRIFCVVLIRYAVTQIRNFPNFFAKNHPGSIQLHAGWERLLVGSGEF